MNEDDILASLEGFGEEEPPAPKEPPPPEPAPETPQTSRNVLFPGILPDPFEPDEQIVAMGVVDLRSLRSALYLMAMQINVALASVEQLELAQARVQEQVKKKER